MADQGTVYQLRGVDSRVLIVVFSCIEDTTMALDPEFCRVSRNVTKIAEKQLKNWDDKPQTAELKGWRTRKE